MLSLQSRFAGDNTLHPGPKAEVFRLRSGKPRHRGRYGRSGRRWADLRYLWGAL